MSKASLCLDWGWDDVRRDRAGAASGRSSSSAAGDLPNDRWRAMSTQQLAAKLLPPRLRKRVTDARILARRARHLLLAPLSDAGRVLRTRPISGVASRAFANDLDRRHSPGRLPGRWRGRIRPCQSEPAVARGPSQDGDSLAGGGNRGRRGRPAFVVRPRLRVRRAAQPLRRRRAPGAGEAGGGQCVDRRRRVHLPGQRDPLRLASGRRGTRCGPGARMALAARARRGAAAAHHAVDPRQLQG